MRKLKSVIAALICIAMISAFPAFYASAYDREIFINEPESYAASLGITEEALTELVEFLYDSVERCRRDVNLSRYGIKYAGGTNADIVRDLLMENPKAFNVKGIQYSTLGQNIVSFTILYKADLATYKEQVAECDAVAEELTEGLTPGMPEALKAMIIHDRLVVHCQYSLDYEEDDYNAYGALVGGKAVCQGYTRAYSYLLNYVGINNYSCPSDELAHVWNIVVLDGVKYHVDVTWDDPLLDVPGRVGHWNLFLSSDALYSSYPDNHAADDYDTSPVSTAYDGFFWQNSQAQFCLMNDTIYYIDHAAKTLNSYDYTTSISRTLLDLGEYYWPASATAYWTTSYARLATYKGVLYYSLPEGVYTLDPVTLVSEPFFLPDMSAHNYFSVYGFDVKDGVVTCLGAATPNLRPTTEMELYTYRFEGGEIEEPVVKGDMDGDGTITVADALVVLRAAARLVPVTPEILAAGDVDGDGAITVADALAILRVAAKLIPSL
ncbi:MAG: hypothetical protein IKX98_06835 [Clostridia bacterium]|nr:hypothetical protein [Clostridia bacterium]